MPFVAGPWRLVIKKNWSSALSKAWWKAVFHFRMFAESWQTFTEDFQRLVSLSNLSIWFFIASIRSRLKTSQCLKLQRQSLRMVFNVDQCRPLNLCWKQWCLLHPLWHISPDNEMQVLLVSLSWHQRFRKCRRRIWKPGLPWRSRSKLWSRRTTKLQQAQKWFWFPWPAHCLAAKSKPWRLWLGNLWLPWKFHSNPSKLVF